MSDVTDITREAHEAGIRCLAARAEAVGVFPMGDPDDPDTVFMDVFQRDVTMFVFEREGGLRALCPIKNAYLEDNGVPAALREMAPQVDVAFARASSS